MWELNIHSVATGLESLGLFTELHIHTDRDSHCMDRYRPEPFPLLFVSSLYGEFTLSQQLLCSKGVGGWGGSGPL